MGSRDSESQAEPLARWREMKEGVDPYTQLQGAPQSLADKSHEVYTSWLLQDLLRTAETASNYHFDRQKSIGINWDTVTNSLSMCANLQGNTGLAWFPTQSRSCGSDG